MPKPLLSQGADGKLRDMNVSVERPEIAAVVERGTCVEAWHAASVAVVDSSGRLVASFGSPSLVTATRSAIKPFQALALIESGANVALGLTAEDLAIACASHNGLDGHVQAVLGLLSKAQATPAHLRCGFQLPIGYRLTGKLPLAEEHRDPLRHNCSGKHAGFLALARTLGEPAEDYLVPSSRTQGLVKEALIRSCEVGPELQGGTDGCGAPNYALPLDALARGIMKLATSSGSASHSAIRLAMQQHPWLVSGDGRFDFDLMRAFPGNVLAKSGAEGMQIIGFCEPALGIALKIHDGGDRAIPPVACAVLEQLGLFDGKIPDVLAHRRTPPVRNHSGQITGAIKACVTLKRHGA